ncbi:TRAP transporter substrate-binding protein DctP [Alcaligenaceae bacterium]|nr:TRAP transporter substrate-binding protein DctP [Alcaligenaceae bacterium]
MNHYLKKLTVVAVTLMMSTGLAQAADYTMRISHQFPPAHHSAKLMEQFAQNVATETKGKVEVQLFGAAQLFKPQQHHAAVASGQVESALILSIQWGGTIPEMAVTQIPFFMSSPAKQKAFIGSKPAQLLDEAMAKKGVKNIGWIVDTNDLIFTSSNHLLDAPEKFKGVKMRGLNKLFDSGLIAMGAVPVSMPGSEVYQALQTKVIDAALTGVQAASARRYYEVQQFGAATPIFLVYDNLVVNPAWWDGLPKDVQAGIQRAADVAVQASLITRDGVDPADIKKLNDEGMDAIVLTSGQADAMKAVIQPAVRDTFLESTGDKGRELIKLLDEL